MDIKKQLDKDLKIALLAHQKDLVMTLRNLKSAILYEELAEGNRDTGLSDSEVINLFQREAKKRQESADLYNQAHEQQRAEAELQEKAVIEQYLPSQLSDGDLSKLIDLAITEVGGLQPQNIGQVIGKVKQASQGAADGARIAEAVKAHLKA